VKAARALIRAAALAATLAATVATVHRLGRTYGSTPAERAADLPGDELVADAQFECQHAITIDAPAEVIWPWLVQMGWHRGGWYTARWVDLLLFPANRASADEIIPELQHLGVGDFIPDGAPETACGFVVQDLEPARHLVLRSNSHLPLSWRTRRHARLDWTWAFVLVPLDGGGRTRFTFRWRARTSPWWVRAFCWVAIVPADLVMSRDMLRGVKKRAERPRSLHPATPGDHRGGLGGSVDWWCGADPVAVVPARHSAVSGGPAAVAHL